MSEFSPVQTLADLESLDDAEIILGYSDGRQNAPEPGNNRSRSYWHGWRNGMMDAYHMPSDDAARELVRVFVRGARAS